MTDGTGAFYALWCLWVAIGTAQNSAGTNFFLAGVNNGVQFIHFGDLGSANWAFGPGGGNVRVRFFWGCRLLRPLSLHKIHIKVNVY